MTELIDRLNQAEARELMKCRETDASHMRTAAQKRELARLAVRRVTLAWERNRHGG